MNDNEWVVFLQWALPQMQMRWTGFRKVRRQVCKKIAVRLEELLEKLLSGLVSCGALVLGEIDRLPCKTEKLEPCSGDSATTIQVPAHVYA